jgi:hypothetical protein
VDSHFRAEPDRIAPPPAAAPGRTRAPGPRVPVLGIVAVLLGLVPVVAVVYLLVEHALEPAERPKGIGSIVISGPEVLGLALFFLGAPLCGLSSLCCAFFNLLLHRDRGGIGAPKLSALALRLTLLGWAMCAVLLAYIMCLRPSRPPGT